MACVAKRYRGLVWVLGLVGAAAACAANKPQRGGLMLAISTDMAAPKDIDQVGLTIRSGGREVFATRAPVAPNGEVRLPATLAVLAPEDPKQPVRIRLVAYSGTKARVLRDMTVTVPPDRTGQLRVPLNFLSVGSGVGEAPLSAQSARVLPRDVPMTGVAPRDFDAFTQIQNRCGDGATDVGGDCTSLELSDPSIFDDYDPTTIFGGGAAPTKAEPSDGDCFPVECCFESATAVVPDDACTVPSQGPSTNLALVTLGIGTATAGVGPLVPLDFDADPRFGEVGVRLLPNARLQLPPAVCRKMAKGVATEEKVVSVVFSTRCAPKSKATPLCGPASATSTARCGDRVLPRDAGADASPQPDGGPAPKNIELLASGLRRPEGLAIVSEGVFVADLGLSLKRVSAGVASEIASSGTGDSPVGLAAVTSGGSTFLVTGGGLTAFGARTDGSSVVQNTGNGYGMAAVAATGNAALFSFPRNIPTRIGGLGEELYWLVPSTGTFGGVDYVRQNVTTRSFTVNASQLLLGESDGSIQACPPAPFGCVVPTPLITAPLSNGYVGAMAASGTRVFFVWMPDDANAAAHLYRYDPALTPSVVELAGDLRSTAGRFGGVATDGASVYYASSGVLYAMPRDGGTAVRIAPAPGAQGYPYGIGTIAVDALHVYWIARGDGASAGAVYRRRLE